MFKRIVNVVEVLAVVAAAVFLVLLFTNEPDSGGGGAAAATRHRAPRSSRATAHAVTEATAAAVSVPNSPTGRSRTTSPRRKKSRVVTNGRSGMPSFGDALTPEEIQQVVAYTRTL